jgi:hypothetical protein
LKHDCEQRRVGGQLLGPALSEVAPDLQPRKEANGWRKVWRHTDHLRRHRVILPHRRAAATVICAHDTGSSITACRMSLRHWIREAALCAGHQSVSEKEEYAPKIHAVVISDPQEILRLVTPPPSLSVKNGPCLK